ncbi:M20/M25/M40 family metallo-hydrolase [Conexibacter sp. JD483]|uniref:M20/M25/M40 family metallo-hydrolase n=1 Tax=unclassified Conexibacter TaxID=2627773 RepID=UPI0027222D3E|nr:MULTISPECIES: M20/M25/M40 family metallo-hydrolase [unclassified Conexibacter]MDO8185086.1 M20/M25/M40 family metallo-hydrolase [Conexibacter sp. CPCC 205706]MDO8196796.1 M20/M25/M40 family metallo-hydrolase [Conexibacter sp. CPCC 205762]MDR9368044.1 M20/M25/M40 family metallo-hydrolase [Conexibacter sp. JD483]
MTRADEQEREQLGELFAQLCAIESPYGRERACADAVAALLRDLGLNVEEDDAGAAIGADAGNLLARIPSRDEVAGAPAGPSILLCAHLDTVPLTAPVEPVLVDGGWENAREAILGADNKAAVAVILQLARRAVAQPPAVGIELLFTVSEEYALAGAKQFDVSRLRSAFGFVFDHATPIGEVIVASPTYHRISADFHGLAAHAGLEPEKGRSAIAAAAKAIAVMPLGRIDAETTANVGTIEGGSGVNVVPGRCQVVAEARSLDEQKVEALTTELIDHLNDGANAAECDVDVTVETLFRGYRVRPNAPQLRAAEAALHACGYVPRRIVSGGGSDGNAFIAAGFPCLNLANGTERAHQVDERVSVVALEGMLDVALALVGACAEELSC